MTEREGGRREGEEKRREGAGSSLFADDARTVLHSEGPQSLCQRARARMRGRDGGRERGREG